MSHTAFLFCLCLILSSCNINSDKTNTIEETKTINNEIKNYKKVSSYDEFLNGLKKNDTINYEDVEKILNLRLFLKESLPRYIIVTPPNTISVNLLDSIHTSVGFWLMSKDSLFKGTFYDVNILLRKREIVSLDLFSHKSLKQEIHYYKDKSILKVLFGKKSEEGNFNEPGDSIWHK